MAIPAARTRERRAENAEVKMGIIGCMYYLSEESRKDIEAWKNRLMELKNELSVLSQKPVCAKCQKDLTIKNERKHIVGEAKVKHPISYHYRGSQNLTSGYNTAFYTFKLHVCPECFKKFLLMQYTHLKFFKWYLPTAFVIGGCIGAIYCTLWYLPFIIGIIIAVAINLSGRKCEKSHFEKNTVSNPNADLTGFLIDGWFADKIQQKGIKIHSPNSENISTCLNKDAANVALHYDIKSTAHCTLWNMSREEASAYANENKN